MVMRQTEWRIVNDAGIPAMEMMMKKTIDTVAQTVTFTFDGEASVVFNLATVSQECIEYATLHGFAARIGDAAAITKSAENGFRVTEAMRRAEVMTMAEHYASGTKDWNLKVAARAPAQNATIAAIAAKLGISYEQAQAKVIEQFLADLTNE